MQKVTAMRLGIIGLGLMGGSLGLAMQTLDPTIEIIGLDHNPEHCTEALRLGIADRIVTQLEAMQEVDILILSVPVDGIIALLKQLPPLKPQTTVIDFGSTKAKIVAAVPETIRSNFVAAHPMTGTEKFGPTAALPDLYRGKTVVLCDIERSGAHQQEIAKELFDALEMTRVYMDAKAHDRHAAFISHMPHALSYALANSVMAQEEREAIVALAGGGFRDMSRIAKSSPAMWRDIFEQNQTNLLEAIDAFSDELAQCRQLVAEERWDELNAWMASANTLHEIL
jgi:prephenate dehydrogenase